MRNSGSTAYVSTTISLPETLALQPAVRFRWHVLGGSGGTLGTFRLDDISLYVFTTFDLAIRNPILAPTNPKTADAMTLTITVLNQGKRTVSEYSIDFFLDDNEDGLTDTTERFERITGVSLSPGDSAMVTATHTPLPAKGYRFIVALNFPSDEDSTDNTLAIPFRVSVTPGTVVVNEIMYAPSGDEPEWIELFNTSKDSIDLENWRISDSNVGSKSILALIPILIPPSSFAIIAKDTMFQILHPEVRVPVAICGFSALNNTSPDAVVLYDSNLNTVDSVHYLPEWGGQNGISLERLDAFASSVQSSNWASSTDSSGSTPGRTNSVIRLDEDLALRSAAANGPTLTILVKNVGKSIVRSFAVDLSADQGENPFDSVSFSGLLHPDATAFLTYTWADPPAGETTVRLHIRYSPDRRSSNDTLSLKVTQGYVRSSMVINEIMYEPASGQNEWIELYNRSEIPLNAAHWSLSDGTFASGSGSSFILSGERTVNAHGYLVVAADSTILALRPSGLGILILNKSGGLGLGNDGDDVVLKDLTGATIDSMSYRPSWHTPDVTETRGRSLERINPDHDSNDSQNWGTSADPSGSTPGVQNTLFTKQTTSTAALSFSPNPFSPDADGFEDVCIISYRLPSTTSVLRVRIFDRAGRLIRTLTDGAPAAASGEIIWDGYDSERRRARIGPYIVLLEAVDNRGGIVATVKGVLIVATKL